MANEPAKKQRDVNTHQTFEVEKTKSKALDFERKQLRAIEANGEVTPNTIQDTQILSDLFK